MASKQLSVNHQFLVELRQKRSAWQMQQQMKQLEEAEKAAKDLKHFEEYAQPLIRHMMNLLYGTAEVGQSEAKFYAHVLHTNKLQKLEDFVDRPELCGGTWEGVLNLLAKYFNAKDGFSATYLVMPLSVTVKFC